MNFDALVREVAEWNLEWEANGKKLRELYLDAVRKRRVKQAPETLPVWTSALYFCLY